MPPSAATKTPGLVERVVQPASSSTRKRKPCHYLCRQYLYGNLDNSQSHCPEGVEVLVPAPGPASLAQRSRSWEVTLSHFGLRSPVSKSSFQFVRGQAFDETSSGPRRHNTSLAIPHAEVAVHLTVLLSLLEQY